MEVVSYISPKHTYKIVPITDDLHVNDDIASVADIIEGTDVQEYKSAVLDSIDQELAYSVYKDEERVGFVYNRVYDNKYYCASIRIDDPIAVVVALRSMFEIANYTKILFLPHNDNLKYFKSMIDGHVIRAFHSGLPSVSITKKRMWDEGVRLFKYFGLEKA